MVKVVKRYKRKAGDTKRLKSIKADEYKEDVAKLRTLRLAAKLSQRALAALINESQSYITNVECRVRRIDAYEARCWEQACREHIAKEAVRRALASFAGLESADRTARREPPARSTVADGASTSQPTGIGLPLAADALGRRSSAGLADHGSDGPPDAPRVDAPVPFDAHAPASAPPEKPERE